MDLTNTKLIDFINIILEYDTIKDVLDTYNEQPNIKGMLFERIGDILIKFNLYGKFNGYSHILKNVSNLTYIVMKDLYYYLCNNNVYNSCETGITDIVLRNEDNYIFITSKYFERNNHSLKDYDISDIRDMAQHNKFNYSIYFLVKDKHVLLKYVKRSKTSFLKDAFNTDNIIDLNDIEHMFLCFKSNILKYGLIGYINISNCNKPHLNLRLHQSFICNSTFDLICKGNKEFIWGCKPRSGKSYMCGGLISLIQQQSCRDTLRVLQCDNVLIITPAPTETISQFMDDLFLKYSDFNAYNIILLDNINKLQDISDRNIIVVSKQFIQNYLNESNIKFNLIFFDENHYGGTTIISLKILNNFSDETTIKIYMTGTYEKSILRFNVPQECIFTWDINDEALCKNGNIADICNRFNLNEINNDDILFYQNYPKIEFLTTLFEPIFYQSFLKYNGTCGFSMDALFMIENNNFINNNDIMMFFDYITGHHHYTFSDNNMSIFKRIRNISTINNSRTTLTNDNFTTQLWFLPCGGLGSDITLLTAKLSELMKKHNVLKHYEILDVNAITTDIKQYIKNIEKESKDNGKYGLIILSGMKLSLGITLPLCDVVFLLNNASSFDMIYQMMMRAASESITPFSNNYEWYKSICNNVEMKKSAYVIDFKYDRILQTTLLYNSYNNNTTNYEKLKYLITNNIIGFDSDIFLLKKCDIDTYIKEIITLWNTNNMNNIRSILKRMENDTIELNTSDQNTLNKYISPKTNKYIKATITLNNQDINTGITRTIEDNDESKEDNKDDEKDNKDEDDKTDDEDDNKINISLTKDILPFIIPFTCLLTLKQNNYDFHEMLKLISCDTSLTDIFNDQCFIWWNKPDIINLIETIITRYIQKESDIFNIVVDIKLKLQSLIDNPNDLILFINDCLKPKQEEKKKYGEVFTPLNLVNEMLDKLPKEVWYNPNLKWLDPANGMGNFPICVYLRLMNTLKEIKQDEKERKRHILENMLYMTELNKKNVFISKQIFDINDEYKLNIKECDFLKEEFNEKYDIILGNPPYQESSDKGKSKGGGNNLYTKFIYKADTLLQYNGYLLFINPPSFFSIGRSNNKNEQNIRKDIFDKYYIHYINLEECAKYFNVGSKFIYYLIQKNDMINEHLRIICKYKNKVYDSLINQQLIRNIDFLPLLLTNESLNICKKIREYIPKLNIFNSPSNRCDKKHIIKISDNTHIYPIQATGNQIVYSSIKCDYQYNKKVLMSRSGYLSPFYDNGINGIGGDCFGYIVENENEANNIIQLLNNEIYTFFIEINKWSGFHHVNVLKQLPLIIDINNIAALLNLTNEEIQFIYNYNNLNSINMSTNMLSNTSVVSNNSNNIINNTKNKCIALTAKKQPCKKNATQNNYCNTHFKLYSINIESKDIEHESKNIEHESKNIEQDDISIISSISIVSNNNYCIAFKKNGDKCTNHAKYNQVCGVHKNYKK